MYIFLKIVVVFDEDMSFSIWTWNFISFCLSLKHYICEILIWRLHFSWKKTSFLNTQRRIISKENIITRWKNNISKYAETNTEEHIPLPIEKPNFPNTPRRIIRKGRQKLMLQELMQLRKHSGPSAQQASLPQNMQFENNNFALPRPADMKLQKSFDDTNANCWTSCHLAVRKLWVSLTHFEYCSTDCNFRSHQLAEKPLDARVSSALNKDQRPGNIK
jgi:hypothetical protein